MARIKGPRKIHRYRAQFKLKAVKLSHIKGVRVQDVADALDIHPFMLSRWRKELREGRIPQAELQACKQREVQQLA
jgi:transposase